MEEQEKMYFARVEEPADYAREQVDGQTPNPNPYPKWIQVPLAKRKSGDFITPTRNKSPEEWVIEHVLSKHVGSVVTLFAQTEQFVPATHVRRGDVLTTSDSEDRRY